MRFLRAHPETHPQVIRPQRRGLFCAESLEILAEPKLIEGEDREAVGPGFPEAAASGFVGECEVITPGIEASGVGWSVEVTEDHAALVFRD